MIKILTIITLLITPIAFAQKEYVFDYQLEYDVSYISDSLYSPVSGQKRDDRKIKKTYITNSKDNSYHLYVTEKDSVYFRLVFRDYENGSYMSVFMTKEDFLKVDIINVDCKHLINFGLKFPSFYKPRHYQIKNLEDSLINGSSFSRYQFKAKKFKRKRLHQEVYIIDPTSISHLPLFINRTHYNLWKKSKNIKEHVHIEKEFINEENRVWSNEKLKTIKKRKLIVRIPEGCLDGFKKSLKNIRLSTG